MEVINCISEMRLKVDQWKKEGLKVGLVPTMGNLHRGHTKLVDQIKPYVDRIVVSIFVNPLQFGANEDYDTYPRTLEADKDTLSSKAVDAIFAPQTSELYPSGIPLKTEISITALSEMLCGEKRPGHFEGMLIVVVKLLNIVQPHFVAFGKKDYQQLKLVEQLVCDLSLPVHVIAVDTEQESDGLALSSRNSYLTDSERDRASALANLLDCAADIIKEGGQDHLSVLGMLRHHLDLAGFDVEYVSLRRRTDLNEAREGDKQLVLLAAARLGKARLIDNREIEIA
jgi:pantoate--beta-alanine ligase